MREGRDRTAGYSLPECGLGYEPNLRKLLLSAPCTPLPLSLMPSPAPLPAEVEKLCRAKYQDNLENMQWFKSFYERNYAGQAYDPLTRRTKGRGADSMPAFTTNAAIQHSAREQRQAEDGEEEAAAAAAAGAGAGAGAPVATKAPAVAAPKRPGAAPAAAGAASKMGGGVGAAGAAGRPAAAAAAGTAPAGKPVVAGAAGARIHGVAGSSSSAAAAGGAGAEALRVASRRIEELQGQVEQLNGSVVSLERERDFYYGKLRDVEVLLQSYSGPDKPTADAILQILYATEGDFVSVDEQGNPILPAGEQEGN